MTQQPQPLDLDTIEARTTAATPGPWGYYDGGDYADVAAGYKPTGPISYTCTQSIARIEADEYEAEDDDEAANQMRADAEFITHARVDVPALVAEIRRLTAELDPYDALQLGHPDGRISTTCTAGKHPTWLRYPDDTRYYACPWCESERLTAELQQAQQQNADASAYRYLADGISNTMPDQNEWDGDDAEETILLRYVQHLAKQAHQ